MEKFRKRIANLMVVLVRSFHLFFSFGGCCRFEPTCSKYCAQSVEEQGFLTGFQLSIKRIVKCHPLGGRGFDFLDQKVG